ARKHTTGGRFYATRIINAEEPAQQRHGHASFTLPSRSDQAWRRLSYMVDHARGPVNPTPTEFDDKYAQTDYGNAERLVGRYGHELRYCDDWKKWLVWDGRRWATDSAGAAVRCAKDTVRQLWRLGVKIDPKDRQAENELLRFKR